MAKTPRLDTRLEAEGAEFLVLGHLLLERIPAYKTYTNMPGYDLVATNPEKNTAAKIQVKSRWRTNAPGFPIKNFNCDFVVLCRLNRGTKKGTGEVRDPDYYVFPVNVVLEVWNPEDPWGKIMLKRIPSWERFQNRWDLISDFLGLSLEGKAASDSGVDAADPKRRIAVDGALDAVSMADFQAQVEGLNGSRLLTAREKRAFMVHTSEKGLTFTPESSGKPRSTTWKRVERVLLRFRETGSLRPVDYVDITRHGSYILALLRHLSTGCASA